MTPLVKGKILTYVTISELCSDQTNLKFTLLNFNPPLILNPPDLLKLFLVINF